MSDQAAAGKMVASRGPRLRSIALPAEHGSWGLVLEPILLGLLVAPTMAGFYLALATFAAFLANQPLRIWLADRRRRRHFRRSALAGRVSLAYLALAVAALGLSLGLSLALAGPAPLLPYLLALPFLLVYAVYEGRRRARSLAAEAAAPIAFAAVAPALALAAGWPLAAALALWAVLAARSLPAILYIRARLRLEKGQPAGRLVVWLFHLLALAGVLLLLGQRLLPASATVAMLPLLLRAVVGLSSYRRRVSIKIIGVTEMGLGFLTVIIVAAGYWLQSPPVP